jgi:ADP-ribose pyrophosphatase YjhB (NUDIX family)
VAPDTNQPPKHSVSVAAAILDDDGRFLVIRRADNGRWEPPGGVLELSESITDGLVREVHEETGLLVRPVALTGVYKNMTRGIVALVFRCEIAGGQPRATSEAREFAWLPPDGLTEHMSSAYSVRLLDALHRTAGPSVRAHDGTVVVG